MNKELKTIQEHLKIIRTILGLTQKELCTAIGISRPTYIKMESMKKELSKSVALAIYAAIYGRSLRLNKDSFESKQLKQYLDMEEYQTLIKSV